MTKDSWGVSLHGMIAAFENPNNEKCVVVVLWQGCSAAPRYHHPMSFLLASCSELANLCVNFSAFVIPT